MPNEDLVVTCPKCGMQYEIPPEYLGQSAECSGCSLTFVLALPHEKRASAPPVKTDIATACTKCGSCFEVAAAFLGETAECPDCSALFVIADVGSCVKETPPPPVPAVAEPAPPSRQNVPSPSPAPSSAAQPVPPPQFANRPRSPEAPSRKTDVNELTVTEAEKDLATNTIKISRKAFGMKPDIKDHFYQNLPPSPPEPERPKRTPPPPPPPPAPAAPSPSESTPTVKAIPPVKRKSAAKVWWNPWTWFR